MRGGREEGRKSEEAIKVEKATRRNGNEKCLFIAQTAIMGSIVTNPFIFLLN